jgi:hypothetical protein
MAPGGGPSTDCRGTIDSGSANLLQSGGGCTGPHTVADPLLDPDGLDDNGGPTQTVDLLTGSPAIDAGLDPDALLLDQRGLSRVVGAGTDIGALEVARRVTVNVVLDPATDPGLFDSSGAGLFADASAVVVSVVAAAGSPTKLGDYASSIDCGSGPKPGSSLALKVTADTVCTVTLRRNAPPPAPPVVTPPVVKPPVGCLSGRRLTVRVFRGRSGKGLRVRRDLRGARVVSARLTDAAGRSVGKVTSRRLRITVDFRSLKAGVYTLRATVRLRNGKRVKAKRSYRTCANRP